MARFVPSFVWLCLVPPVLECKVPDTPPTRTSCRKFDFLKFQGCNEVSTSSVALCAAAFHPTMENTWENFLDMVRFMKLFSKPVKKGP